MICSGLLVDDIGLENNDLLDVNMEEPLDIPLFSWVFEANDSLRSPDYHSLRSIKGTEKGTKFWLENALEKL